MSHELTPGDQQFIKTARECVEYRDPVGGSLVAGELLRIIDEQQSVIRAAEFALDERMKEIAALKKPTKAALTIGQEECLELLARAGKVGAVPLHVSSARALVRRGFAFTGNGLFFNITPEGQRVYAEMLDVK